MKEIKILKIRQRELIQRLSQNLGLEPILCNILLKRISQTKQTEGLTSFLCKDPVTFKKMPHKIRQIINESLDCVYQIVEQDIANQNNTQQKSTLKKKDKEKQQRKFQKHISFLTGGGHL